MKIFYHITTLKNFISILHDEYIIPNKGRGFVSRYSVSWQGIFLTDDPDYVIKTQLTNNWIKDNGCVILKLNASHISVNQRKEQIYTYENETIIPHEFICKTKIGTDYIEDVRQYIP